MSDRKLTLFELHFDGDLSFGPTFGGGDEEEPAVSGERVESYDEDEDESGGVDRRFVKFLAILVVLGVLGAAAQRMMDEHEGIDLDVDAPEEPAE